MRPYSRLLLGLLLVALLATPLLIRRHRADWETYHTRYVAPDRLAGALRSAGPTTR